MDFRHRPWKVKRPAVLEVMREEKRKEKEEVKKEADEKPNKNQARPTKKSSGASEAQRHAVLTAGYGRAYHGKCSAMD